MWLEPLKNWTRAWWWKLNRLSQDRDNSRDTTRFSFHHPIAKSTFADLHQSDSMAEGEKFRWEPAPDPDSIVIPGLNTAAPTVDQIEQIDQLITLKLQVSFVGA